MKTSGETPSSRLSPLAQPFTSNRHVDPGFQTSFNFSQYPSDDFQDNHGGHSDSDFNFNGVLVTKSFMDKYSGGGCDGNGDGENSMSVKLGKPAMKRMNDYAKVPTPSAGNTALSLDYPICSEFVVSGCNNAQIEPHLLLKAESQLVCNEKVLMNKGKDIKNVDTVFCGVVNVKKNAELQVTCPVVRNDVTSKPLGDSEASVYHGNSSVSCDYDDSELDSPCWKGTQIHQATSEVFKPVDEHALIIEAKETNCLNPRALHFYPRRCKIDEYFHANESARDGSTSLQSIASLPHTRENTTLEGSFPLEVSVASGIQYSGKIHEPKMGAAAHNGSTKSFIASSSCYLEPSLMEENYTVDSRLVTGSKNTSSFKFVGNADHRTYTHDKNVLKSFFSGVGDSSKFTDTLFGSPMSSTQKFDVPQTSSVGFEHADAQLKNGVEAANRLNPLARQFYPGSAKRHVNNRAEECLIGDSPCFVKPTSLTVVSAAQEHKSALVDFQEARGSENAALNNYFTSRMENIASSSFSEVRGSFKFSTTFSGASKCNPQLLINSMYEMSEQLIHNCSNDLHSFNEQQHKKIEQIINNLYVCTINKDQQKFPMPESVSRSKSYELGKSANRNKQSDMRMKNMTIQHSQERQKKFSDISVGGPLDRSYSNIESNNEISGLIRNTQTEEDMNAEALLYKRSWLEAEATLCYLKYKMGQMQIK